MDTHDRALWPLARAWMQCGRQCRCVDGEDPGPPSFDQIREQLEFYMRERL